MDRKKNRVCYVYLTERERKKERRGGTLKQI